jgi:hypothetical protein
MRRHTSGDDDLETEEDADEYEGYSLVDENGDEINGRKSKKKKKESYDDGETVEASPIPLNEQLVIVDNPNISGLDTGARLTLRITDDKTGGVYHGEIKAGDFKSAFIDRLLWNREGSYCECILHSAAAPVMVKLIFYEEFKEGTTLI